MNTTPINGTTDINKTQDTSQNTDILKDTKILDKDDFLKLFVTQLKNQDPLNPMENYEVAAQLAQYSSLEQLVNINSNFQKFINLSSMNSYFQGINLIGKHVEYEGDKFIFKPDANGNGSVDIKFKINEASSNLNVNIYDENGNYVKTLEVDDPNLGENIVKWDGKDSKGQLVKEGVYKYEVLGYNEDGEQVDYTPYGYGSIDSIRYDKDKNEALVKVNNDELDITKVFNVVK
jgi:flagellar basal-body rod modification protein FlgD